MCGRLRASGRLQLAASGRGRILTLSLFAARQPGRLCADARARARRGACPPHHRPQTPPPCPSARLAVGRGVLLVEPSEAAESQRRAVAARGAGRHSVAHDHDGDGAHKEAAPRQLLAPPCIGLRNPGRGRFVCAAAAGAFCEGASRPKHTRTSAAMDIAFTPTPGPDAPSKPARHRQGSPGGHLHCEEHAPHGRLERGAHAARRSAGDEVADVAVVGVGAPGGQQARLRLEPAAGACPCLAGRGRRQIEEAVEWGERRTSEQGTRPRCCAWPRSASGKAPGLSSPRDRLPFTAAPLAPPSRLG